MRHGQTDLNVEKRLQGSSDTPLNAVGRNQALETHEFLVKEGLLPTKVISSPLSRALETACLASGFDKSKVEIERDLIEMSFGEFELKGSDELDPEFIHSFFKEPQSYVPPKNGESYDEAYERVDRFFKDFKEKIRNGEILDTDIVLLVSHGATSHVIFEYLANTERKDIWNVDFNNCALAELLLDLAGNNDSYHFITKGFQKNW